MSNEKIGFSCCPQGSVGDGGSCGALYQNVHLSLNSCLEGVGSTTDVIGEDVSLRTGSIASIVDLCGG